MPDEVESGVKDAITESSTGGNQGDSQVAETESNGSEAEKPQDSEKSVPFGRFQEVINERNELRSKIEEVKRQSEAQPDQSENEGIVSERGEKLISQVAGQVKKEVLDELQKMANDSREKREEADKRIAEQVQGIKDRLGDRFEAFQKFATEKLGKYSDLSVETLEQMFDESNESSTNVTPPTAQGDSSPPQKATQTDTREDFVTTMKRALKG